MKKNVALFLALVLAVSSLVACAKPAQVAETTVVETTAAANEVTPPPIDAREADYTVGMNVLSSNFGIFFDKYKVGEEFSFAGSKTKITGKKVADNTLVFKGEDDNNKADNLAAYVAIVTKLDEGFLCYQNVRRDDNELYVYCQYFDGKGRGMPIYFSTNKDEEGEKTYNLAEMRNGSEGKMNVKGVKNADGSITKTIEIVDSLGYTVSTNNVTVKEDGDGIEVNATQVGPDGNTQCEYHNKRVGKATKQEIKIPVAGVTVINEYDSGDLDIDPNSVKASVVTKG